MVYPISQVMYKTIVGIFLKKVNGIENIPKKESFVFCSNHVSFLDDVLIPEVIICRLKKYIHMYVNSRFYKNRFLKILLDHYGCIAVFIEKNEYSKKKNEKAFRLALNYLKKGEFVGIFPEGIRSIDGKLKKAKNGAAKLALSAKVAILPMGIVGSHEIWPKGKKFPKLKKRVIINIGKPMYFKKYYRKINKKNLRQVTKGVMKEIARLSNQEYRY